MEIKTEKKPETFCYMLHICVEPPLYAINTILVWFHHIPDLINHANFGVDRVIGSDERELIFHSHSRSFIPIPIHAPICIPRLFPFPSIIQRLFPFPPIPIPVHQLRNSNVM
jgi:hypothetical protein